MQGRLPKPGEIWRSHGGDARVIDCRIDLVGNWQMVFNPDSRMRRPDENVNSVRMLTLDQFLDEFRPPDPLAG